MWEIDRPGTQVPTTSPGAVTVEGYLHVLPGGELINADLALSAEQMVRLLRIGRVLQVERLSVVL